MCIVWRRLSEVAGRRRRRDWYEYAGAVIAGVATECMQVHLTNETCVLSLASMLSRVRLCRIRTSSSWSYQSNGNGEN
jgi:hypothetical protein